MPHSSEPIRTALVEVAGFGTRFLPQTKAVPKEMLPIINKPVIQLIVEELADAGVTDIIIVTDSTKRSVQTHFERALQSGIRLWEDGESEHAKRLREITKAVRITYIQQEGLPRGNARPLLNAAHLLDKGPFYVFFGDNFFTQGPKSRAEQLREAYQATHAPIISMVKVDPADADKYGMATLGDKIDDRTFRVKQLIEKPGVGNAPSHYGACGGYILTPDLLPIVAHEKVDKKGEITLADSINEFAQKAPLYGRFIEGKYHDTGVPEEYLETVVDVALDDPHYGPRFKEYLRQRLAK